MHIYTQAVFPSAPTGGVGGLEASWEQLARMYRELGERDVVLRIHAHFFSNHPSTLRALTYQLAGDTDLALEE